MIAVHHAPAQSDDDTNAEKKTTQEQTSPAGTKVSSVCVAVQKRNTKEDVSAIRFTLFDVGSGIESLTCLNCFHF